MRKILSLAGFLALSAGLIAVPAPAHAAAVENWLFTGATGATYVNVLDGTVSSDLTAASSISGIATSSNSNSTAAVDVTGLLSVGAAQTTTSSVVDGGNTTIRSYGRTAGVDLLNGLIKIDAVETDVSTIAKSDGTVSATGGSKLLGIKIVGIDLPVNIPKNYAVTIPGVATVSLNAVLHAGDSSYAATQGWAVGVQLLAPRAGYRSGVTLMLNPYHHSAMETVPQKGARLGGDAYSSRVEAKVGDRIKVVSDATAAVGTPLFSSGGETIKNSTASANVPGLLTLGTLTSTSTSSKSDTGAEILNTNKTAGLNLLGGLITADAIGVSAEGKVLNGAWTSAMKMTLVNLTIAGNKIPIDVSPNTTIDVAGLGKVEINNQVTLADYQMNRITGLRITLNTERAGLPVGAVIELASASTIIEKVS